MKKNKENILITRTLSQESPIWQLSEDGHHLIAHSFLNINPKKITEIPSSEIYFYYSKNAAKYFIEAAKQLNVDLTKSSHATMGPGTASILAKNNIPVDFVGINAPNEIAKSLISKYSNHSICFVRAEQSTQSIQKLWPHNYQEVIAYSVCPKDIQVKESIHTILATSPMNLIAAMNSCNVSTLKRIICIGPTTYSVAKKLTTANLIMANKSSEQSMIDAYLQEIELDKSK